MAGLGDLAPKKLIAKLDASEVNGVEWRHRARCWLLARQSSDVPTTSSPSWS